MDKDKERFKQIYRWMLGAAVCVCGGAVLGYLCGHLSSKQRHCCSPSLHITMSLPARHDAITCESCIAEQC